MNSSIKINQPQPFKVETALNLAYGERLVDPPRVYPNLQPILNSNLASRISALCEAKTAQEDRRRQRDNESLSINTMNQQTEKQQILRLRTDTPLWFVPEFHPIEVVGISADPVSKEMFCTIKVDLTKLLDVKEFCEQKSNCHDSSEEKESSDDSDDADDGEENDKNPAIRMLVVSLVEMRRRFPHLVIDFLLARAVFEQ